MGGGVFENQSETLFSRDFTIFNSNALMLFPYLFFIKFAYLNKITFEIKQKIEFKVDLKEPLPKGEELIDFALKNDDPGLVN